MNKKTEKEKKSKINSEKNSTLILSKYHQGFSTKVTHNHNYHFCSTHTHHIKPITFEKISPTTIKEKRSTLKLFNLLFDNAIVLLEKLLFYMIK